jgi:hypothetical protein
MRRNIRVTSTRTVPVLFKTVPRPRSTSCIVSFTRRDQWNRRTTGRRILHVNSRDSQHFLSARLERERDFFRFPSCSRCLFFVKLILFGRSPVGYPIGTWYTIGGTVIMRNRRRLSFILDFSFLWTLVSLLRSWLYGRTEIGASTLSDATGGRVGWRR